MKMSNIRNKETKVTVNKNENAITLISLVVTIIILIILSGLTLSLIMKENGLFDRVQLAVFNYKKSQILENLELEKTKIFLDGKEVNISNYIEKITEDKIINENDIEEGDTDLEKYIEIDGYIFSVTEVENDIVIDYEGKIGKILAKIKKVEVSSTKDSITVNVLASKTNDCYYKFYIKNITAYGNYELKETNKSNKYTFNNLVQNNNYQVKVELTNEAGTVEKETNIITTGKQLAESIILDKTEAEVFVGDIVELTATVNPDDTYNNKINWTSKNEDVATVNEDGKITTKKVGIATIIATTTDGSEKEERCIVKVKPKEPYEFNYTGKEQELVIPLDGVYKLETWGAQGGSGFSTSAGVGGYGAYSSGNVSLDKGCILYINVGGCGSTSTNTKADYSGGYNGGGNSRHWTMNNTYNSPGGGATHIATKSGVLSTLEKFKDEILIVSGGGGGGSSDGKQHSRGGNAGGIVGGAGQISSNSDGALGLGGSQTAGGSYRTYSRTNPTSGSFGNGGTCSSVGGSGGGSGFYGGGGASVWMGAGGGSSYIGNPLLTNKVMYCYNGTTSTVESTYTISTNSVSSTAIANYAKQGNGYARITLISLK